MKQRLLVLLLVFLTDVKTTEQFNPLKDPNICGRPKCELRNKFNYKPGIKYNYQYAIDIETLFQGTSKNSSGLHVDADFTLEFNNHCEGKLSFSRLRLSERENEGGDHEHSQSFSDAISKNSLRFSFHDGIVTEICPVESEANWVLNFKRGVLSMLHNTMSRFDLDHETTETDVHGTCETKYTLIGPRNTSLIIKKTKNIESCQDRYKHQSILQTTPYNFRSNYQVIPIMKSNVSCELSIDHHVYNEILCHEKHIFQPFSNQDSGATTLTRQRLKLIKEYDELGYEERQSEQVQRRASMLYNHNPSPKPTSGELRESRDLIKKLCEISDNDMQMEFSDLFTKFIHISRLLSPVALQQLYKRTSMICPNGRKHIMDALPFMGSSASVALMTDIILTGELPMDTVKDWLMAFTFLPRPDETMLISLLNLLQHESKQLNPNAGVFLSVSAVVHSYCRTTSNCADSIPLKDIVMLLEERVISAHDENINDRLHREAIVVSLKALANIGILSEDFNQYLWKMISDETIQTEIRVSAINTYRRLTCIETRDQFLELFRNQEVDSEVRIAAYLQVMTCPNYITIRIVRHCLEVEEVNQVGSFIWSHLYNLLKSSIPSRIEIQGLLSDKDLGKKFSNDVRKFSHNYEGSVFFDEYNVGGNYESNVIFSPSSYVPKSAMLNFTIDLFGESVNLFEVSSRVEGLEYYFESIFGPKGPLNSRFFEEKLSKIRFPRSVPTENELLTNEIDTLPNIIADKFGEPKVSLGLKIFGNEVNYNTFVGDKEIKAAIKKLNPVNYLKRMLSGQEINFNKAGMFLDTSYIVPCGAGVPITLNAIGTAAVNLKMFGSLRGADFMQTKELDLIGSIRPSATIDVVGTMSVDAYYVSTGIKLKSNMFTSTAVEGEVKIRGSRLVSVRFSLPSEKTEIFSAHSDIVIMHGEAEESQIGITENAVQQSLCSWPVVDKTIGLKLCAKYRFPNVTKLPDAPYYVLAGPSKFQVFLQKADPTAKDYVFEYKWTTTNNSSVVSVAFDTPGSSVRRLLSANLTLDVQSQNLTLLFETAAGTTLAKGKYKNTDDEKYVYIGLDINGKKHFDVRLSLTRKESKYGHIYHPKLFLGVNDERVAELNGSLKSVKKKGIQQWDISISFQTKRLNTHLAGYVTRSDVSLATKLNLNYQFLKGAGGIISSEFKIGDRSTSKIKSIHADFKLECSAYPQFNFTAAFKYQTGIGHVDCKLDINSKPQLNNKDNVLTAHFVFISTDTNDGNKLHTYIEIRRPATQLDMKLQFRHEVAGAKTNIFLLGRYSKEKEMSIAIYLFEPRGNLFFAEGKVNVTLSSFTPMVLEGKILEKNINKFDIELKVVWFTGHNLTATGRYEDKGTRIATSSHLKLHIMSPSFHEINAACSYYRDRQELKLEIKADQKDDIYGLTLKHGSQSQHEMKSHAEVKYKTKVYSVTSVVNLLDYRQILLDIHIDTIRDIHIVVRSLNNNIHKEFGLELKWNANRDPDQKLMISLEFTNPEIYNYRGKFLVSYPGRTINCVFDFAIKDHHFLTFGRIAWSSTELIELTLSADYRYDKETLITIKSELLTPFQNWKRTSINSGYRHLGNMYQANGSVYWLQNQYVSIDVLSNYTSDAEELKCEFGGSIVSTIPNIPSVSGNLQHYHNKTKTDSNLRITYDPKKVIAVKSIWELTQDKDMRNLTGTVSLLSPFSGYNKGILVSKIYITRNMDIRGVADLDLDLKKYTASLEGHLKRISESMFFFNATTPIQKYSKLTGRFGFSESKRHLVAEISAPSGAVGVELLFYIISIADFDIKFNLATPVEFLQNALVIGKLKTDRVDFRLGWNKLMAGFAGVWHYKNLTDFEYSYKIYTPIDGLEENGIVAKLILRNGLDSELSVRLANTKVGIAIDGKPKPKLLKELGIKKPAVYNENDDNDYEGDIDELYGISWSGRVELNTIVWPVIQGSLDIDQTGDLYTILVTLSLPDGIAELRDEFYFSDMLSNRNQMHLITPYECYNEIKSNYKLDVIIGSEYYFSLNVDILNKTQWIETGTLLQYVHINDDDEIEIHNASVHIHTPFISLPRLDMKAGLEIEENVSRINFTLSTNTTDISIAGSGEADDGYLETSIFGSITSPSLNVPPTQLHLKKDFSDKEDILEVILNIMRSADINYKFRSLWHVKSIRHFRVELKTEIPIHPLENFETGVSMFADTEVKSANVRWIMPPNLIDANGTVRDNLVHAEIQADILGSRQIFDFNGNIVKLSEKQHNLAGVLKYWNESYDVTGNMNMYNDMPGAMDLEFVPTSGGEKIMIRYTIQPQESGCALRSRFERGDIFATLEAHVTVRHKFDWDLHMQMDTSIPKYRNATIDSRMVFLNKNNMSFIFESKTPIEGLQYTKLGYVLLLHEDSGNLLLYHDFSNTKGDTKIIWKWRLMENMSIDLTGNQQLADRSKEVTLKLFYVNPNRTFKYFKIGGDINVDNSKWTFGSNVTVSLPSYEKIDVEAHLKLPFPKQDVHTIIGLFHSQQNMSNIKYLANYRTLVSERNYIASGNIFLLKEKKNVKCDLKLGWGPHENQTVNNIIDLIHGQKLLDLSYKFKLPANGEEKLKTRVTYIGDEKYHNMTLILFYPVNRQLTDFKVDFNGLTNMNGTINITTPFENVTYAGAHFDMETTNFLSNRRIQAFWPNNTALMDSQYKYKPETLTSASASGVILLDVPLTTRHVTKVDYGYTTKTLQTTGAATINYNSNKIVKGTYKCDSESRVGFDKDTMYLEVENKFIPIGLTYIHQFEYNAPGSGSILPTMDLKYVELFNLHNRTGFNITGKMNVNTSDTGKQITIKAIHSNRTVTLNADYDVQDQRFIQKSRLQLAPTVWLAYDLDIINNTEDASKESQQIIINVSYPRRNFTLLGSYSVTNSSLYSEACLSWDKAIKAKSIELSFDWERFTTTSNHQIVELQIRHPSFERNVSFKGEYQSTDIKIVDIKLDVIYSNDENKKLSLSGAIEDHSNETVRNLTFEVAGSHPETKLKLLVHGETDFRRRWYHAQTNAHYKRTYLPLQSAEIFWKLDTKNYEVEYEKKTEREPSYFHGKCDGSFPMYTANISAIRGSELNASGEFYMNFIEKLLKLELNVTEDGSQSLHMYGAIPDARSAMFNIWRDYEDIRVSDVAYFLRLNHSRLVVSRLTWRPELKSDIKSAVKAASVDLYNNFTNDIDYWKTYIRSETTDAVKDIWEDAKPIVQQFLDDVDGLKLLVDDIEEMKLFLNESYHANEFYIHDIVEAGMYVLEELSIRSHIESLPAIVNEIWEVLGESGEAIRKSIFWIIHTVKESYRKAAEFINGLVKGDSLEQLSALLDRFVEKYDKFVKDMHVSFIRYVENLWNQVYVSIVDSWRKMLKSIEPTFITFAHYVESIVYQASKELLDFLYLHTSEFVESPYFSKFSMFTQDLDKFYKDFTNNDAITLIYKYSNKAINFFKEKYAAIIPFGKELKDIATEILNELQELKKLPSIQFVTSKWDEYYTKLQWFYNYFDVGTRVRHFIILVHSKLTDMTLTALQAENRYREAKTKFVFEPKTGVLHLEQKLPMSWHAFNETPKFEEIPEYKTLSDLQNYFVSSNTTFWALYYDYKPYTDPKDWFPPFTTHAMIAGSQHYMTFDKKFYEFSGLCTYLLAHDFLDKNFSMAISYNPDTMGQTHTIHLLLKNNIVNIDLFANTVAIDNSTTSRLPLTIGDAIIYQEADILTVDSKTGFALRCNLKFDVCMMDVSGWYFGKTAGLWGTINNEPSDDFLASTNRIIPHLGRFTQSWSLKPQTCSTVANQAVEFNEQDPAIIELCDSLFISKVSPFNACFQRVHTQPFHNMCLKSGSEMRACTSAVAYIQACKVENTPLRIPDVCIKCYLPNGNEVKEGVIVTLENQDVPITTDIVFLIEAKKCNANIKNKRNIDSLVSLLQKELTDNGINNNRYSVVVFGGDGVLDEPRNIIINNEIFTSHQKIPSYFDDIPVGNGSSDIFGAINFASQLIFRPGASKTFILLPCTDCDTSNMKLDYPVLHQLLLENDITLHILMNEEFHLEKTRMNKVFFGMDSSLAYTKKDSKVLKGDAELRRQVKPPKSVLGYCAPLALETNGTVFTAKKLEEDKRNAVKKFALVFVKRVAKTAKPCECQTCECNAQDNGVSYMECYPCDYPIPAYSDYNFNEDDLESIEALGADYDSNEMD